MKKFYIGLLLFIGILIGSGITARFYFFDYAGASDSRLEKRPSTTQNPFSEQSFIDVSKRVTPAVVNISTKRMIKGEESRIPSTPFSNGPFLKKFFGQEPFTLPEIPKESDL
jgi:S1-C subfamily serine protease